MASTRFNSRNTSAPRLHAGFVDRPRLSDHVAAISRYRLVVVHAPAGSGKTSLLSSWVQSLRSQGALAAWYSVTDNERDHMHLADCLLLAVLRAVREDSDDPPVPSADEDPDSRLIAALRNLLGADSAGRRHLTLFVDDFHLTDGDSEIRTLSRLLSDVPDRLTLIIAGRNRPALPLGRYRLKGELLEISARDLQFSAEEVQHLFRAALGRELSSLEAERLQTSTEGWAAGLRLTTLVREMPDSQFLQCAPAGSQREYAEYFLDEVIAGLPDDLCRFLEQTSILDALTPELCDALTGQAQSAATLELIEREQLFITYLPGSRRWYKYHQLFQEFLQARLRTLNPALVPELHTRAAEWYLQANMPFDAVRHSFLANRPEQAAVLIERYCTFGYLSLGRFDTFSHWMTQLSRETRESRPLLMFLMVWRYINHRQFLQAEQVLQALEIADREGGPITRIATNSGMNLRGRIDLMRSLIGAYGGDLVRARRHIDQIGDTRLDDLPFGQVDLLSIHSYVALNESDLEQAERLTWRANTIYAEIGSHWGRIHSLCIAGMSYLARNRWEDARRVIGTATEIAREHFSEGSYMVALPSALRGSLAYRAGDHAEAEMLWSSALPAPNESGVLGLWERKLVALLGLIRLYDRQGRESEATALLRRFRRAAIEEEDFRMEFRLNIEWADRALRQGDLTGAQQPFGRAMRQRSEAEALFGLNIWQIWEPFGIMMARAAAASMVTGNPEEILRLLADKAQKQSRLSSALSCRVIASRLLRKAGPDHEKLLAEVEAAGLLEALGDELGRPLVQSAQARSNESNMDRHPDLIAKNDLTPRECEVLALIRVGARNSEIGAQLGININTVKTHTKNIFSKLNVRNRTEAVIMLSVQGNVN